MEGSKKEVRKYIKALTAGLSPEEKRSLSDRATYLLENEPVFIQSEIIALYWSLDDEVDTHRFIEKWHSKKTILLPVIEGNNIFFTTYDGLKSMTVDERFGIPEPGTGSVYNVNTIELIVVPGIAFDHNNNRLGRGKGYYDRALNRSTCTKIGLCFPHQYVDRIPSEAHDIKLDKVLFA